MNFLKNCRIIYQDITFEELVKAIEEEITKAVQALIEGERK